MGEALPANIRSWRQKVLAAEAKKAGIASEDTLLTPRPPCFIGMDACNHCMSDNLELVMRLIADFRRLSNV
jgi:hypothetical protein